MGIKFKPDWWLIIGVPLGLYMWYILLCFFIMMRYNSGYSEKYVIEMPVGELVHRMDSVLAVHPEYGNQVFVRTWHYKTRDRRIYPERMLRMGSGKDTVWVRLLFDSINPHITIMQIMDLNRKIRKNGIYYLWTPQINTYEAGLIRSYKVRKEIQEKVIPALNVKWQDRTPLIARLGPIYSQPREWFLKDVYWPDPPPKRKPKKKDKETETTDTVANDTI